MLQPDRLTAASPRCATVAGAFPPGEWMEAGALEVSTFTPRGAVLAVSLDGRPLESSGRLLVQMASVAENRGQALRPARDAAPNPLVLDAPGSAPVRTLARRGPANEVRIAGRPLLRVPMVNGSGDRVRFRCDLPGVEAETYSSTR